MAKKITQDQLKEIVRYEDGGLYYKKKYTHNVIVGKRIGSIRKSEGYRVVMINRKEYSEHQLVFLYFHGYIPKEVDHKDHNRLNNLISNLLPSTRKQNGRNQSVFKTNKTGVSGVAWHKPLNKWASRIKYEGKLMHLGYYNDIEEAISMRLFANSYYGFHENHGVINRERT